MKTNIRQGMVQVNKVPNAISSFLEDALSGYDRIMCYQQKSDNGASFTFLVDDKSITLSVKGGV